MMGSGLVMRPVASAGVITVLGLGALNAQPYHPPLHQLLPHAFSRRTGFTSKSLRHVQRGGLTSQKADTVGAQRAYDDGPSLGSLIRPEDVPVRVQPSSKPDRETEAIVQPFCVTSGSPRVLPTG
jgi:hypothetical protein